ncbi:MAG: ectoine utilization protein EutA [Alphaproteobacteria bacterium]|nr:ectoine utilization protein EutA [Alphaproteobacteria bacterium]
MDVSVVQPSPVPVKLDEGSPVKKIGLVALSTDLTLERDFHRICSPDRVGIYTGRVLFENPTTPENLRKMLPRIEAAVELILSGSELDAVCYGCTAATVHIGDQEIQAAVQSAKPGVPVVTPSGAGALGLKAVGAKRISVLTPYTVEVSRPFADYFTSRGFEVVNLECLGLLDDRDIARVSRETILEAGRAAMSPDSDALFLSCTALRAVEYMEEVEAAIGKPAVSSNQASVWLTLRRAGVDDEIQGFGRLLTLGIPD